MTRRPLPPGRGATLRHEWGSVLVRQVGVRLSQGAPNQTGAICVTLIDSHRRDGLDEVSLRRLTASLVVCSLGSVIAPVAAGASVVTSNARTHAYRLPTDGWKPGEPAVTAAFRGRFYATLTTSGASAWIGSPHQGVMYLWPVGYRVRFHPTELLSPNGKVVAHQDQEVNAGGGVYSQREAPSPPAPPVSLRYCGTAEGVAYIESPVLAGVGPS